MNNVKSNSDEVTVKDIVNQAQDMIYKSKMLINNAILITHFMCENSAFDLCQLDGLVFQLEVIKEYIENNERIFMDKSLTLSISPSPLFNDMSNT